MPFLPVKKGTLLKLSGNKEHLFVILTEECSEKCHLLVNFSSIHDNVYHDDACVVNSGEYRLAETVKASHLAKCNFTQKEPVSDELFKRICDGLILSRHASKRIKKYFIDNYRA